MSCVSPVLAPPTGAQGLPEETGVPPSLEMAGRSLSSLLRVCRHTAGGLRREAAAPARGRRPFLLLDVSTPPGEGAREPAEGVLESGAAKAAFRRASFGSTASELYAPTATRLFREA
jgi:hypothetical protein